jgi:AMP-binding enzyme
VKRSARKSAFDGGWFHSGDLAIVDGEGYLTIVDRKKDMIKTGGDREGPDFILPRAHGELQSSPRGRLRRCSAQEPERQVIETGVAETI